MRTLTAVILARKGSKRLPGKNTRLFIQKPLIQWTIDAAIDSGVFDKVIVSTDAAEVKDMLADKKNVEIFSRSSELAQDESTSIDSLLEVIEAYNLKGDVALLQPTSPLRNANDCREAVKLYFSSGAPSVVSVTDVSKDKKFTVNSKDGKSFMLNGAIYLMNIEKTKESKKIIYEDTSFYYMSPNKSVDIDTVEDWDLAEKYYYQKDLKIEK